MMREWPAGDLKKLSSKTDLMVWTYGAKIPEKVGNAMAKFTNAGITMWGASAFKGGHGVMADVPNPDRRTENLLAWIKTSRKTRLKGMVATGWSRYNTFVAPCESMEVSLDTLVLAAWSMWDGSLPSDASDKAEKFLVKGILKKLAGKRFLKCKTAGTELQNWRNESLDLLKTHWVSSAYFYGEKERRNPWEEERIVSEIKKCLAKGRKLSDNWYRTHKGLIPEVWLKYYVRSRLWQVEKCAGNVLEKLSGKTG